MLQITDVAKTPAQVGIDTVTINNAAEAEWAGLVAAFVELKPLVDAAVACAEVEALRTLEV
jgi:hypothetical protein